MTPNHNTIPRRAQSGFPTLLLFLSLLSTSVFSLSGAPVRTAAKSAPSPATEPHTVPLGKLDPFWRYSAVLGPFLEGGLWLTEIPDYLVQTDFPYHKRPYPKEVPFADHLSIVRLLGGYNDGSADGAADMSVRDRDLAYRDASGKIVYRMHLLKPRLQPFLEQGYTNLTLVLDNVPWCFPAKPGTAKLGQHDPPRDPKEWQAFIQALCVELRNILGPQAAQNLRFRVGTENNGRERFNGTYQEFLAHYDHAAAAIMEVLPGAKFGAFNISSASVHALDQVHNVHAFALAEHCLREPNLATGKIGTPFDWVAFSRYYAPSNNPAVSAQGCQEIWDEFERRLPALKGMSREIHEFGVAPFGETAKGQFVSAEPGALGAALTAHMMFRLRQAGINRLWHWTPTDTFRDRKNQLQHLFTSQAWLLTVLDHATGGDACLLEGTRDASGTSHLGLASFKPDETLLILAAYNPDVSIHTPQTVRFQIPKEKLRLEGKTLRYVVLDRQTAMYDRMRQGLRDAKLLKEDFISHSDRLGNVRQMSQGRPAEQWVGDRLPQYQQSWKESLTLKPLDTARATFMPQDKSIELRVTLAAPEVLVLVVR